MKEEKYIEDRVGKRNPFLVPDGYFDQFPEQFMNSLPKRQPKAKSIWLRPIFYAAASICALLICTGAYLALSEEPKHEATLVTTPQQEVYDEFDEAADYMMLDNHDIYALLSEN